MKTCISWRLGFRQSGLRHVARISRRTAPYTWARPPVSWHAVFPYRPFGLRSAIRSRDNSSHLCPLSGRYSSAPHGALTQFSTWPVHPACCGATHAVASPFFSCAVSSIAIPGPIRSSGSHGSHAARQRRQLAAQVRPVPPVRSQQRLHPVRALVPGLLSDRPAVRLGPRRQRGQVARKRPATLRRCAITRPSTALTCASTLAVRSPRHPLCWPTRPCRCCFLPQSRQRVTAASNYRRAFLAPTGFHHSR